MDFLSFPSQIEGPALQEVDDKFSVLIHIDGILDINRRPVDTFQRFEDPLHETGKCSVLEELLAAHEPDLPGSSQIIQGALGLIVMLHHHPLVPKGQHVQDLVHLYFAADILPAVQCI